MAADEGGDVMGIIIEAAGRYYSVDEEIRPAATGRVLVHNHVRPAQRSGTRGFRCWEADPEPKYVACGCGWRPELGTHHRVESPRTSPWGARRSTAPGRS